MEVKLKPGKYILAVSGGVDSVVLLDLLSKQPELDLVVAHFDHGIRFDSDDDGEFVARLAKKYGLVFELGQARLGKNASEETARNARYQFLETARKKYQADDIVTAHHKDDLIETAFINILRGTGPRGLVSLADKDGMKRPLLGFRKKEILAYAQANKLHWREDKTNQEDKYLRNYLRRHVVNKLSSSQRDGLVENIEKVAKNREETEQIIATYSQYLLNGNQIDRQLFALLPVEVANEFVADWFRQKGLRDFDKGTITGANAFIRIGGPGKVYEAGKHLVIKNTQTAATLVIRW